MLPLKVLHFSIEIAPFILVVAQDTDHARQIHTFIESEDFFKGRFKEKVIEVHSAQRGEESDEAMQRLVALERDGRTEIVIHVNKLKEGWDVTNLYTIVLLRAAASEILTEQTLGRGLRLPYGARVTRGDDEEFAAVDRLTVIAHDRFDEIIKKAKEPGSIVMRQIEIGQGGDISSAGATLVEAPSIVEMMVTGHQPQIAGLDEAAQTGFVFSSPEEGRAAEVALDVIRRYERKLGDVQALRRKDVQEQITAEVRELMQPVQATLAGIVEGPRVEKIVNVVATTVADRTISIPQIVVIPKRQVTFRFEDFDLKNLESINVQPIEDGLVIQNLRTEVKTYLAKAVDDPRESRMEDYLVRYLIERNEIDYDAHADLLYKLAGQLVGRLRTYLVMDAEIESALLRHGRQLAEFVFAQMMQHYKETPLAEDDYEIRVTRGFNLLKPQPLNIAPAQKVRDFSHPVTPASETRRQVFGGFKKCCYPLQKFDSDPERRLAALIEAEPSVEKWMKPGRGQFQIEYRSGEGYEPDFVVETKTQSLILEVKARNEQDDAIVQAKAAAASKWCRTANLHVESAKAKPWQYALVPDDQITGANARGLAREILKITTSSGLMV
jgi:type III restriction enzyme